MRTDNPILLKTFVMQSNGFCAILHFWFLDRFEKSLPSTMWHLCLKWQFSEEVTKTGDMQAGSVARICKITEPLCQGFVRVFVIKWLKRSLSVWLRSNEMLTRPWSCLSNIISLDKKRQRRASSVPLNAIRSYKKNPEIEMLTIRQQLHFLKKIFSSNCAFVTCTHKCVSE